MKCLRPELKNPPPRIEQLPLDDRGFPIPAFVDTLEGGKRDFRFMSARHWLRCVRERLCWVCGDRLGAYLAFVIGPMCAVNRTTSEPPCHLDCARWSAQFCPFLSRPRMTRREDETTARAETSVFHIDRNPGVACIWVARDYELFADPQGRPLVSVGAPVEVEWWAEGRVATRAEVLESITTGMPFLEGLARLEEGGIEALAKARRLIEPWLPPED